MCSPEQEKMHLYDLTNGNCRSEELAINFDQLYHVYDMYKEVVLLADEAF